jgi:hypothetical protein
VTRPRPEAELETAVRELLAWSAVASLALAALRAAGVPAPPTTLRELEACSRILAGAVAATAATPPAEAPTGEVRP